MEPPQGGWVSRQTADEVAGAGAGGRADGGARARCRRADDGAGAGARARRPTDGSGNPKPPWSRCRSRGPGRGADRRDGGDVAPVAPRRSLLRGRALGHADRTTGLRPEATPLGARRRRRCPRRVSAAAPTRRSRSHQKDEAEIGEAGSSRRPSCWRVSSLVVVAAVAVVHPRHHPTTARTDDRKAPAHAAPPPRPLPKQPGYRLRPMRSTPPRPRPRGDSHRSRPSPRRRTSRRSSIRTCRRCSSTGRSCPEARCRLRLGRQRPAPKRRCVRICNSSTPSTALPPLQLGRYLKQFDADATQLQTTLSALEQNLRAATS